MKINLNTLKHISKLSMLIVLLISLKHVELMMICLLMVEKLMKKMRNANLPSMKQNSWFFRI